MTAPKPEDGTASELHPELFIDRARAWLWDAFRERSGDGDAMHLAMTFAEIDKDARALGRSESAAEVEAAYKAGWGAAMQRVREHIASGHYTPAWEQALQRDLPLDTPIPTPTAAKPGDDK